MRKWILLALLAAPALARAGDDDSGATSVEIAPTADLRAYLTAQLDAEAAVLTRTRATVDQKVADAATARAHRARIAYKLISDPGADTMSTARRRAAARWVLTRDRDEETLLADESQSLGAADARLAQDRTTALTIPLPQSGLDRPVAHADIARHFGTFVHDRSKATLSRRGIDLDCADHADVHPVADGTVTYAGPIRGLDDGLVVDHGGWLSVYGKLDTPTVAKGDHVVRGETIGHAARKRVYLEIRIAVGPGGVPVDPERLLQ